MNKDKKFLAILLLAVSLLGIILNFIPGQNSKSKSDNPEEKALGGSFGGFSGSKDKILALDLTGVMMDGGGVQSFIGGENSNAVRVRDQLIKAAKEKSIKGVILRINSPGGAVGISQEIYNAIKDFRKTYKKPIIASMGDIAASGGYYAASACDMIFANPGTLTGSIGVVSHFTNFEALYNKFGVKDMTIKAGLYKDIGSSTRPMTAEEKEILQSLVDDTYDQFIEDVYLGRRVNSAEAKKYGQLRAGINRQDIRDLAQGMIYTGKQANQVGLVDKLGGYNEALKDLQKLVRERSKGDIKEDLDIVHSIGGYNSLKEVLSMSSSIKDLLPLLLGQNPLAQKSVNIQTQSMPNLMMIAPEFIYSLK